ncbi:MAG TPA: helix-turn-helix domain-containing protein [Phenylobacterium sp.]|uniref:TetR/AcrR family transcriptional regulator n=1 Tax=Phenylobacterium sp. TaxID=1871053 RepID=UPI002B492546|nr:helix-turn-helix domain-containing protein [Phenylobacterium sp.]HKR89608.1 helix-turn-helix domain-containing protein [Phenylobacterium sp.]
MPRLEPKTRSEAAEHLKMVAQRLFAERGVDGVTVREIAEAAGQKNHAAVGYHFGCKEGLIRELVIDGAALIDARRNEWLDRLEGEGGQLTVRELVDLLIQTALGAPGRGEETFNRFVVMLGMTHRRFFEETLGGRWNSGYLRCLDHLRRLMPDMPLAVKNQRFVFLLALLGGVLAGREAELADAGRPHLTWGSTEVLDNLGESMAALLEAPHARR